MGGSTEDFAFFCGGFPNWAYGTSRVDCYNKNLIKQEISNLTSSRYSISCLSTNDKILLGGGFTYNGTTSFDIVESYNNSLIRNNSISPLSSGSSKPPAALIDEYFLFNPLEDIIDIYNNSLVKMTGLQLDNYYAGKAASFNNDYALFGGGSYQQSQYTTVYTKTVEAYNSLLVKTTAPDFVNNRGNRSNGLNFNNFALFFGADQTLLEAYSGSLVKAELLYLSTTYVIGAARKDQRYVLFSNGDNLEYILKSLENSLEVFNDFLGMPLIPESESSATDNIFIGNSSGTPQTVISRKGRIFSSGTVYVFIKKSLFNFSKYGDTETADNAKNYLTIIANSSISGNGKHFCYTIGSGTSTHFRLTLYNVASPFRIYLQN